MLLNLMGKQSNLVEAEIVDTGPTERRSAKIERRRRADRRKNFNQNYSGISRRETIDRRESLDDRRNDT